MSPLLWGRLMIAGVSATRRPERSRSARAPRAPCWQPRRFGAVGLIPSDGNSQPSPVSHACVVAQPLQLRGRSDERASMSIAGFAAYAAVFAWNRPRRLPSWYWPPPRCPVLAVSRPAHDLLGDVGAVPWVSRRRGASAASETGRVLVSRARMFPAVHRGYVASALSREDSRARALGSGIVRTTTSDCIARAPARNVAAWGGSDGGTMRDGGRLTRSRRPGSGNRRSPRERSAAPLGRVGLSLAAKRPGGITHFNADPVQRPRCSRFVHRRVRRRSL